MAFLPTFGLLPTEAVGDCALGRFVERALLDENRPWLPRALDDILEAGWRKVLLDCGNLEFVSTSNFGAFVTAHRKFEAAGAALKFCRLSNHVSEILRLTRLDRVLALLPDGTSAPGDIARDAFAPPVAFDPAWRTSDAVALARSMYDSRDFTAMPILADALQDAGCEDEQVLSHCRDANQVHVRGCWVCDLVLGRA